jgi:hypothetical protein
MLFIGVQSKSLKPLKVEYYKDISTSIHQAPCQHTLVVKGDESVMLGVATSIFSKMACKKERVYYIFLK